MTFMLKYLSSFDANDPNYFHYKSFKSCTYMNHRNDSQNEFCKIWSSSSLRNVYHELMTISTNQNNIEQKINIWFTRILNKEQKTHYHNELHYF